MSIVLLILKIIGIVILCILALVLLLLLILLFAPVKYSLEGSKYDKFEINAKFTWLFSIISVKYILKDQKEDIKIRLPFIYNYDSNKKPDDKKDKKPKYRESEYKENNEPYINENKGLPEIHHIENTDYEYDESPHSKKESIFTKIKNKLINILKSILKIVNVIKSIKNNIDEFNREFGIKRVFKILINFLKELIVAIKPKIFKANGSFGLDDPANTGMLLGGISIIKPFVPGDINISGDFENTGFWGELYIKGSTNLLFILIPTIKFIFTEPIMDIIKKYWR